MPAILLSVHDGAFLMICIVEEGFEYQVYENGFSPETEIDLLDSIIKTMASQEWYEVSAFFKNLKLIKLKNMFGK